LLFDSFRFLVYKLICILNSVCKSGSGASENTCSNYIIKGRENHDEINEKNKMERAIASYVDGVIAWACVMRRQQWHYHSRYWQRFVRQWQLMPMSFGHTILYKGKNMFNRLSINPVRLTLATLALAVTMLSASGASAATAALLPNTAYTVTLEKFLSDGTLSTVGSTAVTSDANGKIAFTFSNVPTCPTTNFLSIKVEDAANTVVRRSFSPAPPAGSTNSLGANGVSTKQGEAMVATAALLGSDNPMAVSFGLLFTRTDQLTTSDISNIAILGREAIVNGMGVYMLANGVTAAQMTTFKQKLICNQPNTDLSNFTSLFKSAVDTPAQASDDMAKAAAVIGDAFIAAAAVADIDLDVILAGFDSAGDKVNTGAGQTAFNAISAAVKNSMLQAVNSFRTRLAVKKVQQRYSAALTALGVSGTAVTTFNTAVTALGTNMSAVETLYGKYFDDPANNPMTTAIQNAMDAAFTAAFNTFSTAIASSNADITTMRANISTAMGGSPTAAQLATSGVGTYRDFSGTTKNWPIPQTGSVNFVATNVIAGGGLTYTRSTIAIPANMVSWLAARTANFGTGNTNFEALLGMQEDVMIAENTRYDIYNPANASTSGNPTGLQRQAAQGAFKTNMAAIAAALGGTTDGTTALTTLQKRAMVLSQQQPSIN